jgi:hypothetical protein
MESHPFTVGAVDMSQFIQSSISGLQAVKSVSVKADNGRVQVEVAVDKFEWKYLEQIYEKELYLSDVFRGQALDFRVIDESPNAGEAAHAGGPGLIWNLVSLPPVD